MGFLLTAIGFVPDVEQADEAVFGLRLLYGGTPLLATGFAALLFSRYPLTREVYVDVQRQLEARRRAVRGGDEAP